LNLHNGTRQETYAIEGQAGSGVVCLNGPAARHACEGDILVILAYGMIEDTLARKLKPKIVFVDERNKIVRKK